MNEMLIAKLAETARRMKADSYAKMATVAVRVHVDEEDQTRVTYSAHVGEHGFGITEVANSLDELVAETTPQLASLKDQHKQQVEGLLRQAKQLGYVVMPAGVSGVAVLEGGE